jgi:hypothetical protein
MRASPHLFSSPGARTSVFDLAEPQPLPATTTTTTAGSTPTLPGLVAKRRASRAGMDLDLVEKKKGDESEEEEKDGLEDLPPAVPRPRKASVTGGEEKRASQRASVLRRMSALKGLVAGLDGLGIDFELGMQDWQREGKTRETYVSVATFPFFTHRFR